jgi:REP element-mobilizing transposase RayT
MGGYVYHAPNRAVGPATLFHKEGDHAAFETVLRKAREWQPIRLLAYCLMPNHWRLVLWPRGDGVLSRFVGWLTLNRPGRPRSQRCRTPRYPCSLAAYVPLRVREMRVFPTRGAH